MNDHHSRWFFDVQRLLRSQRPPAHPSTWMCSWIAVPRSVHRSKDGGLLPGLVNVYNRLHNYGTSPFLMGKSTINGNFHPFSIAMLNYQRVQWGIPSHHEFQYSENWSLMLDEKRGPPHFRKRPFWSLG